MNFLMYQLNKVTGGPIGSRIEMYKLWVFSVIKASHLNELYTGYSYPSTVFLAVQTNGSHGDFTNASAKFQ